MSKYNESTTPESEVTQFGFNFGSLEVTRTCSDKSGVHVISIKTPKAQFSVRATKTGQLRFFNRDGKELELVNKDYISILRNRS